ncbi:hypothetical protein GLOIN_2v1884233 [Rhizophagus clarus]|uniref:F-box domain-containing protein n=1 Tax=Rhizophagus clarus TaxID=94130 RepID=A0A8H3QRH3_9GLOM|nr:hypothetical protein GLOIN_2v1884233 [Rhizophagus clarus]
MSKLNIDIILSILEELQNDKKSLYTCLLVNKAWCEMTVPILWKEPDRSLSRNKPHDWQIYYRARIILLHIFLEAFEFTYDYNMEKSKLSILKNEVLKLFINNDKKFISLYIPGRFNSHLFSEIEHCFSELENFYCDCDINDNILEGIMSTNIKKFVVYVKHNCTANHRIFKLIEAQKNLKEVNLIIHGDEYTDLIYDELDLKKLEKSIINVQILFISLEIMNYEISDYTYGWNHLANASFPFLKFLRVYYVPSKTLASLIKSTKGHLIEISIDIYSYSDYEFVIQAIYQHCPNLNHIRLPILNDHIKEFQKLLINCKFLNSLEISGDFNRNELFNMLIKFSSINLFKLYFHSIVLDSDCMVSLKLFFSSWKNRRPMLLIISSIRLQKQERLLLPLRQVQQNHFLQVEHLFKRYKAEGVIKDFRWRPNYYY